MESPDQEHANDDPLLQYFQRDGRLREVERELEQAVGRGATLLAELARTTASHLLGDSLRRIQAFEAQLQQDRAELRRQYEDRLGEIGQQAGALVEAHARSVADVERAIAMADARFAAYEQTISRQMADAARQFQEAAAMLRDSTARMPATPVPAEPPVPAEAVAAPIAEAFAGTFVTEAPAMQAGPSRPVIMAAVVMAVLACGYAWYLAGRLDQLDRRAVAAEQSLRQAQQDAASTRQSMQSAAKLLAAAASTARTVDVLAAPDLRRFNLFGRRTAPTAAGQALWSPSRGLVMAVTSLPAPPAGQAYQLWLVTPGGPMSLGVTTPDADGRLSLSLEPPRGLAGAATGFMLSLEPAGGSPRPGGLIPLAS